MIQPILLPGNISMQSGINITSQPAVEIGYIPIHTTLFGPGIPGRRIISLLELTSFLYKGPNIFSDNISLLLPVIGKRIYLMQVLYYKETVILYRTFGNHDKIRCLIKRFKHLITDLFTCSCVIIVHKP